MKVYTNEVGQQVAQDKSGNWHEVDASGGLKAPFAKRPAFKPAPAQAPAPAPAAAQPAPPPPAPAQVVQRRSYRGMITAAAIVFATIVGVALALSIFNTPWSTTAVVERVPVVAADSSERRIKELEEKLEKLASRPPVVAPAPAAVAIDHTRYEQVVQQCPTVMEPYAPQKDALAILYNAKNEKQFDGVLQDCRAKEAALKYPRPPKTERDVANYEKERNLARNRVPKCDVGTFSKEKGKCINQTATRRVE